jgi:uncharacterized membrane protein YdbT with pleckstrin-like domain
MSTPRASDSEKKRLKAEAKEAKKRARAEVKRAKSEVASGAAPEAKRSQPAGPGPSPAVRFAESVRGVLYVVLGASLAVALVLGQQGAILSLDDIIANLFAATAGKVVLAVIALAILIYGLKHLRLVR